MALETVQSQHVIPGPGQESVWDYPRPPGALVVARHVRVVFAGKLIAESRRPIKVMETSHPPVYYLPMDDVSRAVLRSSPHTTLCEYKGIARYFDVVVGNSVAQNGAWYYPEPEQEFDVLRDCVAFYPRLMDEITLDGEVVVPQPGMFYGGWITSEVVGPFKGGPGALNL